MREVSSKIEIMAELRGRAMTARIVRFTIPEPVVSHMADKNSYQLDMCLTPRPLLAKASYCDRWGPHRYERLGDIFLIPPGERLVVKAGVVRQEALICQINAAMIHDIVGGQLNWSDQQIASTLDATSARIRALLLRLADEVRHPGVASGQMLEFMSGELAVELARFCEEVAERPTTGGLSGWRLRLIDERLSDYPTSPSLAEVAGLCNISIRQLTRGFKVSRACSLREYIDQNRMTRAKRMLVGEHSIKTIAHTLGFSSSSSFIFAFRHSVGVSPGQFRQRQKRALQDT
jgi:AraC family transcriptional regulator